MADDSGGGACGNGSLEVSVENEFDPDSPAPRRNGLGLRNVRSRLATRFGDAARLTAHVGEQPVSGGDGGALQSGGVTWRSWTDAGALSDHCPLLGKGGMGEVFLAEDTRLHRKVALKVLLPEVAEDPERLARFVQEAKLASALSHPNVAHIYEIGEANGRALPRDGVHRRARRSKSGSAGEPLPMAEIVSIGSQVADALDAAHCQGHRASRHQAGQPDDRRRAGTSRCWISGSRKFCP